MKQMDGVFGNSIGSARSGMGRAEVGGPSVRTGTLWDHFLASADVKTMPRDMPLLKNHFFTDANIARIETAIQERCAQRLGSKSPPRYSLTVRGSDPVRDAVFQAAMQMGYLRPSADHLAKINLAALDMAFEALSHESSDFARWDEFTRDGVTPADAGRPEFDMDKMRSLELKRAPFGKGSYNPHEAAWGGAIDSFDDIWGLLGYDASGKSRIQEVTGSDDDRIRVIPWAPLYRQEKGSPPNYGPAANGFGYGSSATPLHAKVSRDATSRIGPGQVMGKLRYIS